MRRDHCYIDGRKGGKYPWPSAVTKALALEAFILFVFACLSFYRAFVPVHILIILMSISMGIQTTAAKNWGLQVFLQLC